ncbi:MAG: NAD(P)/FAD-dependent oxidoreductase [Intrasporangium sp.]|uniref:NAD(P)/FAD-dependent oxidoreductase n=1 Tax=Intrasporangium sp. TaxID=1925024 RepID=UPI003F80865D
MIAEPGVLIVGASQAGAQVATSLRELGETCPITLVGAEPHLPYQRPPLSKAFLSGQAEAEHLQLRSAAFYKEHGIDVVLGERVVRLDLEDDGGRATCLSGRALPFSRLALTVGGTPRRLSVPGSELRNVFYLRDLADATALRRSLASAERVVVVGGGFVGLESASVAKALGKDVTVVEALDRLLARAVAPVVSQFYLEAHRRRGVQVLLGSVVVGFGGDDAVTSVELSDGSSLPADVVLVGIGLVPDTSLAEQVGLVCDGGIVIDDGGRTSHRAVVAAGDCTSLRRSADEGLLRIESVANAISQGRAAAASLAGVADGVASVPWFWSDQGSLKLQIAGLSAGYDDVVLRGDPETEQFSALYYSGSGLIAIDAVNAPRDYMAVRKILESGGSVPRHLASDLDVPLKSLIPR